MPLLTAAKLAISPEPVAAKPILGVSFSHEYVVVPEEFEFFKATIPSVEATTSSIPELNSEATELLSPPETFRPQVTREPSLFNAAWALLPENTFTTPDDNFEAISPS